jgi:hypothetical protein
MTALRAIGAVVARPLITIAPHTDSTSHPIPAQAVKMSNLHILLLIEVSQLLGQLQVKTKVFCPAGFSAFQRTGKVVKASFEVHLSSVQD